MDKNMNMAMLKLGIGKRMPYKTPDGVFEDIERNVLSATGCAGKPMRRLRSVGIAVAAAASLALLVVFSWHRQSSGTDTFAQVLQAFESLDDTDRAFLSEIYNEDTFINTNY